MLASLARPCGLDGLPASVAVQGQAIAVPSGGSTWVNDWASGDNLVLQLPLGRSAELCGLSTSGGDEAWSATRGRCRRAAHADDQPHQNAAATMT